ncbi:MAG: hypothetical protein M3375_02000 [Actinomycetota bacterium]|nr:hypothetical protein [Actinomycetota bacterium]
MIKRIQFTILLIAAGALLAIPAVGQAHHKTGHSKGGKGKSCAKKRTVNKGFVVRGTLVRYRADDPATSDVNETRVEITVTRANRHARVSGELDDTNATKPGVQVAGGSYTVSSSPADRFGVRLSGYETGEPAEAGDRVRIVGKIAVTRKKCATAGASLDERYGDVNVRRVKIIDAD